MNNDKERFIDKVERLVLKKYNIAYVKHNSLLVVGKLEIVDVSKTSIKVFYDENTDEIASYRYSRILNTLKDVVQLLKDRKIITEHKIVVHSFLPEHYLTEKDRIELRKLINFSRITQVSENTIDDFSRFKNRYKNELYRKRLFDNYLLTYTKVGDYILVDNLKAFREDISDYLVSWCHSHNRILVETKMYRNSRIFNIVTKSKEIKRKKTNKTLSDKLKLVS